MTSHPQQPANTPPSASDSHAREWLRTRPAADDHADYYARYVAMVPDGDILETLRDQLATTLSLLDSVPADRETYRYAEGKWTVREVIGHLIDTEWVFGYRALSMAREEGVVLPGMDQAVWAQNSSANQRSLAELGKEWVALRRATVHMFSAFDAETAARSGMASGVRFVVRSFPWIIAGHELWHRERLVTDYGF